MIFIGETINGGSAHYDIKGAILGRDADFIRSLAVAQADAGVDYIDVNAGTNPDRETEDLLWLIDVVQSAVDTPICIDTSTHSAMKEAIRQVNKTPMVDSINGDPRMLEEFLPIIKALNCPFVVQGLDRSKSSMPKDMEEMLIILDRIFAASRKMGIDDESIHVDPMLMSIAADHTAGKAALDSIRAIHERYPRAHITCGLSNISHGLPECSLINRTFLTLAIGAGLDSVIADPLDTELIKSLYAVNLALGNDRFCRKFTTAARGGFAVIK